MKAHLVIIQKLSNAWFKGQFKIESASYAKIPLFQKPLKQAQLSKPKHLQTHQHQSRQPTKKQFKIQNLISCGHCSKQVVDTNQTNIKHYSEKGFLPNLFPS